MQGCAPAAPYLYRGFVGEAAKEALWAVGQVWILTSSDLTTEQS